MTCSSTGTNRGYRDFDHYLESFTAEKRKKAQTRAPARRRGRRHVRHLVTARARSPRTSTRSTTCIATLFWPRPRALSDARAVPRDARSHRVSNSGQRRPPSGTRPWRRRCSYRISRRCMAATGAPGHNFTACISRLVTTRESSSASSAASRASSPAHRANTR